jgi:hypothetical protein
MARVNIWDDTFYRVEDLQEHGIVTTFESEDVLESLIIMNKELLAFGKEDLGIAGMKVIDMRVNIEDAIDLLNQSIAKFSMILLALKTMENHVRDNLPEFTIDYDKYKEMIMEKEKQLTIDYSEMVTDDGDEED